MRPELPILTLGLAWLLLVPAFAAESPSPGDACSTAGLQIHTGGPEDPDGNFLVCNGTVWKDFLDYKTTGYVGILQANPQAPLDVNGEARIGNTSLACSGTTEGALRYNSSSSKIEYCDGASWIAFLIAGGSGSPPAVPGDGYFVLTSATFDGNRGGKSGADADCLSDLTANDWMGKTDANSRGLLISSKVKAFLCIGSGCEMPHPSTRYFFAVSGDNTNGGAYFDADASGYAPNNAYSWSAPNYFGTGALYWTGLYGGSDDAFFINNPDGSNWRCGDWTSSSSGDGGTGGDGSTTNRNRWTGNANTCDQTLRLICFVHP